MTNTAAKGKDILRWYQDGNPTEYILRLRIPAIHRSLISSHRPSTWFRSIPVTDIEVQRQTTLDALGQLIQQNAAEHQHSEPVIVKKRLKTSGWRPVTN